MREVDVVGALRALGGSATVYDLTNQLNVSIPTAMKYLTRPISTGEISVIRGKKGVRHIYQLKNPSRQLYIREVKIPPRRVSLREIVSISIGGSVFDMTLEEAGALAAELNSVISKAQRIEPPRAAWSRAEIENAQVAVEPASPLSAAKVPPSAAKILEYKAQWKKVREHLRRHSGVAFSSHQIMGIVRDYVSEATWVKTKKNLVGTNTIARSTQSSHSWLILSPRSRKSR